MRTRTLVLLLIVAALHQAMQAQTAHRLAFASEGNAIELAIANTSGIEATGVEVNMQDAPAWLRFTQTEQTISSIEAGGEQPALFSFLVDKSAPVGTEQAVTFVIKTATGQSWTKDIRIIVAAPETFELFPNYPNPFNPTTVISYQLPVDSKVSLKVYNLLGQEIVSLVDEEQKAGFHQATFDARQLASGTYLYQLVAAEAAGRQAISQRMMVLVK